MGLLDFFKKKPSEEQKEKLDQGLEKTRTSLFGKISKVVAGKSRVDDDFLDELEEILISSDVGVATTVKIIERVEARVSKDKYLGAEELNSMLKEEIVNLIAEHETSIKNTTVKPYVIMVVGVNGVGKTTTIGKLSNMFKQQGLKVVLGAADTFRAAAVDQIKIWGERVGVEVVAKGMNTDPAAVAF
ncbi:MAG: signal recognition particle-docking protein FtsY, partial [Bacteroidetes bacterium]|nr:signal recognition particle-docking protein FtsY [Bacteroidota bacterium]